MFRKPLFWIILVIVAVGGLIAVGGVALLAPFAAISNRPTTPSSIRISCGWRRQVAGTLVQVADMSTIVMSTPAALLAVIEPSGPRSATRRDAGERIQQAGRPVQQQARGASDRRRSRQRDQAAAQARVTDRRCGSKGGSRTWRGTNRWCRIDPNAVAGQQLDQARAAARSDRRARPPQRASRSTTADRADQRSRSRSRPAPPSAGIDARRRRRSSRRKVTLGDLRLTAPVSGQVVNRSGQSWAPMSRRARS